MTIQLPENDYYKVLVIDDEREFKDKSFADMVAYARTSAEALKYLSSGVKWNQVWFDHDLGDNDDIRRVVEWLEAKAFHGEKLHIGTCYVQSRNSVGVKWITDGLVKHYKVIVVQNDQLIVPKWILALRESTDSTRADD